MSKIFKICAPKGNASPMCLIIQWKKLHSWEGVEYVRICYPTVCDAQQFKSESWKFCPARSRPINSCIVLGPDRQQFFTPLLYLGMHASIFCITETNNLGLALMDNVGRFFFLMSRSFLHEISIDKTFIFIKADSAKNLQTVDLAIRDS